LTRKAVTAALARDWFAVKLSLERLLPRCRCLPIRSRKAARILTRAPAPGAAKSPRLSNSIRLVAYFYTRNIMMRQ
jgi:hypothetical protein